MSIFSHIKKDVLKTSTFNLSHSHKTSMNFGYVYPILCTETVPGDKFNCNTGVFLRTQPLVAPIMDEIDVYVRYFFVPRRILWRPWQKWISQQDTSHVMPYFRYNASEIQHDLSIPASLSLADRLGVPVNIDQSISAADVDMKIDVSPFSAYYYIWNEYFRDENLNPYQFFMPDEPTASPNGVLWNADTDGLIGMRFANLPVLPCAFQKDYFTSALPWPQKGNDVYIPSEVNMHFTDVAGNPISLIGGGSQSNPGNVKVYPDEATTVISQNSAIGLAANSQAIKYDDIRKATALERYLERLALSGNRYAEWLLGIFGVKSSDASLQRPEYLGGGKAVVNISEVAQTSSTNEDSPQGNLAGKGVMASGYHMNDVFIREHGWLMAVAYIRPKSSYFQGIHRQFQRFDPYDFYLPDFQNIGEQEVKNSEIFAFGSQPESTFGYQSRYAEYKYISSRISGDMANSLSFWHLARHFDQQPNLNAEFINAATSPLHSFAVEDADVDHFVIDVYHNLVANRPMQTYNELHQL